MTRTELTDLLSKAKAHTEDHKFICQDPSQQIQVDYWNATRPEVITRLAESYLEALEVMNDIKRCIESYEHVEKRYKEVRGDDAKIAFAKLAEIRAIAKLAREFLQKIGEA